MIKTRNIADVVKGGFCVGCGACAYSTGTTMKLNEFGEYVPNLKEIANVDTEAKENANFQKLFLIRKHLKEVNT